jgi:hypothetical protein
MSKNRPPPYSNENGLTENKLEARSRSKAQGRSQVRLRPDVRRMRPTYSRSESQREKDDRQFQSNLSV